MEGWITALATGITGILAAGGGALAYKFYQAWSKNRAKTKADEREQRRTDAEGLIEGWQDILSEVKKDARQARANYTKIEQDVARLRSDHIDCERRAEKQQTVIEKQRVQIEELTEENDSLKKRVAILEANMVKLHDRLRSQALGANNRPPTDVIDNSGIAKMIDDGQEGQMEGI